MDDPTAAYERITSVNNFNFSLGNKAVKGPTEIFLLRDNEMKKLGTKTGLITRRGNNDNKIIDEARIEYGTLGTPEIDNNLYIENPAITKTDAEFIPHNFATEFTLSPGKDEEPITIAYPVNGGKKSRRRKSRRNKSRGRKSRRRKPRK
jgi:hypothetical protein